MTFILKKYKLVFRFILVFLLVYVTSSLLYKTYLHYSDGSMYYPDYLTHLVGIQVVDILKVLGYYSEVIPNIGEPTLQLKINGNYVARIVEGCNAISIIILFVSFVVAFSGRFKATVAYTLVGSVLIYTVNLFRIALLSVWLYHYPEHLEFTHNIFFPVIIYGVLLILWFFWVNRFSVVENSNE